MSDQARIHDLSVHFCAPGSLLTAVDQISFILKPGKTLALLGESGCGKSLTASAMMRLLPANGLYGQDSRIVVQGEDLLTLPEVLMRQLRGRKLAMVFQEPMTALNPVLTIRQQLAECLHQHQSLSNDAALEKMIALLQEVEMPDPMRRLGQYPHQLSGGQKQRVVIAMALACNPDFLIADEPTTALDVTIQAQILNLLKKLQQAHGMSLLLITHDLSVVKAMADEVCVMYAGQVVEQASVKEFFTAVRHPYSQQLLNSLPTYQKRHQRLAVIKGQVPSLDAMPNGCRFHPRCPHAFAACKEQEPVLQSLADRQVRCLLYPSHQQLPAYEQKLIDWQPNKQQAPVIMTVRDLSVHFPQKRQHPFQAKTSLKAVDGVSFDLHQGQTLALVGESGSGKTTISRAILALLPIQTGEICLAGQPLATMRGKALRSYRKKVQIILQDPYAAMNPRLMVADIIAEGMIAQGMTKSRIEQRLPQLLEQVNLPRNSLQKYPHQFSGGQRQRICIARALATEPEILICDEPTSALDVSVQAQILNLLKELQHEQGLTYLLITHNMAVVSYLADHVMVMKEGRIIEAGTCEQIMFSPKAEYTRQLLDSVLAI